eukprot:gene11627-318_t
MSQQVTGMDIDSGWAVDWMSFEVDKDKFPDFPALCKTVHSLGIRLILWVSGAMMNSGSLTYDKFKAAGYFLNDGRQIEYWHKPASSMLDFENPEAVTALGDLQDKLLLLGEQALVESLREGLSAPKGELCMNPWVIFCSWDVQLPYVLSAKTNTGLIPQLDSYKAAFWRFSPHETALAAWTGDLDATFAGLRTGIQRVLVGAWEGYLTGNPHCMLFWGLLQMNR